MGVRSPGTSKSLAQSYSSKDIKAEHWWLTPIILATQKVEIRRIVVQSQPKQIVFKNLSRKTFHKKGWWSGSR
jgi:hypothetical protein